MCHSFIHSTSAATVVTGRPSRAPSSMSPGSRIISPSSATISPMTPTGESPASSMRSTAASVWPPRSRTPPSTARSGRMWPGRMSFSGVDAGSASTRSVCARSAALMPVEVRSAASTEIVYAVPRTSSLRSVMSGSSRRSAVAFVIGAQRKPLVCRTIHAIHSWVANSAAMMASPSFSRASSSATMTGLPARRASSTSGIVARLMRGSLLRPRPVLRVRREASGARRGAASARRGGRGCRSRGSRGRRPRAGRASSP